MVLQSRLADDWRSSGTDFDFTSTTLVTAARITSGDHALVGGIASIVDFAFHPLMPEGRDESINAWAAASVMIEDDLGVDS